MIHLTFLLSVESRMTLSALLERGFRVINLAQLLHNQHLIDAITVYHKGNRFALIYRFIELVALSKVNSNPYFYSLL